MKLRSALALVLLTTGCYRDLDVPDCAHAPGGCVDSSAPADADGSTEDSFVPTDGGLDSTVGEDTGDTGVPADSADASADSVVDTGGDACSSMTCTTPPAASCASATTRRTYASSGTCSAGVCSYTYADEACALDEVCTAGICSPRSCVGGLSCGSVSCCDSKLVPGGTAFPMGRAPAGAENDVCSTWAAGVCDSSEQPQHDATVSSLRLDTFEVTVGRFRKFVAGYPGNKPSAGAGANPAISGSGWQSAWDASLPLSAVDMIAALKCDVGYTWTDTAGTNESKPINCVDWYTAFAFCAWDGARLPTEAEWEYATAGGAENRVVPWGNTAPTSTLATYNAITLSAVGSTPLGAGRWGQHDLAGNVYEWNLDWFGPYTTAATTNYARLTGGSNRIMRGGSFGDEAGRVRAALRGNATPGLRISQLGVRCAR